MHRNNWIDTVAPKAITLQRTQQSILQILLRLSPNPSSTGAVLRPLLLDSSNPHTRSACTLLCSLPEAYYCKSIQIPFLLICLFTPSHEEKDRLSPKTWADQRWVLLGVGVREQAFRTKDWKTLNAKVFYTITLVYMINLNLCGF